MSVALSYFLLSIMSCIVKLFVMSALEMGHINKLIIIIIISIVTIKRVMLLFVENAGLVKIEKQNR